MTKEEFKKLEEIELELQNIVSKASSIWPIGEDNLTHKLYELMHEFQDEVEKHEDQFDDE